MCIAACEAKLAPSQGLRNTGPGHIHTQILALPLPSHVVTSDTVSLIHTMGVGTPTS